MRPVLLSLLLLLSGRNFAQFRNDHYGPDDMMGPVQNPLYNSALMTLRHADDLCRVSTDTAHYAELIDLITWVYKIEGNYAGALDLLIGIPVRKTYDLARQLEAPDFSLNMQQVLDTLQKKVNIDILQARLDNALSELYDQIGNPVKGLSYQLKSRELLRNLSAKENTDAGLKWAGGLKPADGLRNEYLKASLHAAEEWLSMGMEDSARAIYRLMEKDLARRADSTLYIGYLHLAALLKERQNKPHEAIDCYRQAFARLKARKEKWREYYEMALDLGRLYIRTRQFTLADSVFRRNCQAMINLRYQSVIRERLFEGLCENQLYLKQYDSAADKLVALSRVMFFQSYRNSAGMSESDLSHYVDRLDEVLNLFYTMMSDSKPGNGEFIFDVLFMEMQRKSMVYLNRADLLRQTKEYWDVDIPLPYRPLKRIRRLIDSLYSLAPQRRTLNMDSLVELSEAYERRISSRGFYISPDDNRKSEILQISTQAEGIDHHIEFVRFNYKTPDEPAGHPVYAAFIFEQTFRNADFVRLCNEGDLLRMMENEKGESLKEEDLSRKLYDKGSGAASELYRLVWAPMEPYLRATRGIGYSPAGILNNISMNAIYDGKDYLMDRYALHRIGSFLEMSPQLRNYDRPDSIDIWGNIDYNAAGPAAGAAVSPGNAFPSLGAAETDSLKGICRANGIPFHSHEGGEATVENFKQEAIRMSGVLHIATHGFYRAYDRTKASDPQPADFIAGIPDPRFRCGLAFAGIGKAWQTGLLTAYEVQQLDLHNVQLVTLSACQTGLGDITHYEGDLGLQRAFKLAGVRYLLVSLWKVNAEATTELLALFYTYWLKGMSLNDALIKAERELEEKDQYPPYYWAGFTLVE